MTEQFQEGLLHLRAVVQLHGSVIHLTGGLQLSITDIEALAAISHAAYCAEKEAQGAIGTEAEWVMPYDELPDFQKAFNRRMVRAVAEALEFALPPEQRFCRERNLNEEQTSYVFGLSWGAWLAACMKRYQRARPTQQRQVVDVLRAKFWNGVRAATKAVDGGKGEISKKWLR